MYSISVAASILGVCIKTLRMWDKARRIFCVRTPSGHRRFPIQEIKRILKERILKITKHSKDETDKGINAFFSNKCAIYGRVSSYKQKKGGDLERQIESVKDYCKMNDLKVVKVYQDLGSGLNVNRKGLWRLIGDAKKGKFACIVINYEDRFTWFGYKYLEEYLSEFGVEVICANMLEEKRPESELIEDLAVIVQSFSGKLYGMRSHKNSNLMSTRGH